MGLPSQSKQVGWGGSGNGSNGGGSSGMVRAAIAVLAIAGVAVGGWFGYSALKPGPKSANAEKTAVVVSNTGDDNTNTNTDTNPAASHDAEIPVIVPAGKEPSMVASHDVSTIDPTTTRSKPLFPVTNDEPTTKEPTKEPTTTKGNTIPIIPVVQAPKERETPSPRTPARTTKQPERRSWSDPRTVEPVAIPDDAPRTVAAQLRSAQDAITSGDLLMAREHYYRLLDNPNGTEENRDTAREQISILNDTILFSPKMFPGEPMTEKYVVTEDDFALSQIRRKLSLPVHYDLIARVNKLPNPDIIRLDQKLKLLRGPFHAEVIKSKFRIDIYSGEPDNRQSWRYVKSFQVGLGELGSTPTGRFVVKLNSKLEDPYWINPRTGERFKPSDPLNPIGERWIGLEGLGESAHETGYGLHGTVDPSSIGAAKSMGCVRMGDADIEFVYELLVEKVSIVNILD